MKLNLKLFILFISLSLNGYAQDGLYSQKRITAYTAKFAEGKAKLKELIAKKSLRITKEDETESSFSAEFIIRSIYLNQIDTVFSGLGYITENNFVSTNVEVSHKKLLSDLEDEEEQLKSYKAQAEKPQSDKTENTNIQNRIFSSEASIRRIKKEIRNLQGEDSVIKVTASLLDDIGYPGANNSDVSFVNMPGIEYGYLMPENPKAGISSKLYNCYTVKYLFTRGKSYFDLGVIRDAHPLLSDNTRINEMFLINFGQDFYPRHFGRGKRKFLNLYTGYQIGGFITHHNDETRSLMVPNANLSMGLELFKSKNILLDTKASYFLPLSNLNYNMRGFLCSASFNFVF